ncbi:MAG: endonuclease III [Lachnospiraceae bacterium]|nr:endonuclease III [Lachnospiraceae bacterium]
MKKRTGEILKILDDMYGTDLVCYLDHENAWQLLVATILSAQCTDARVNIVTKDLFVRYPSVHSLAEAELPELEQYIKSTGFFHNKAKNIIACCRKLYEEYNSEVPSDIDELTALPGVGRKTANVIRGNVYGIPSIVVDTHVKRISGRLGLTKETDPVKIEYDLMKEIPKDHWILINIQLITFGRDICKAQNPQCERCGLRKYCSAV